MDMRRETETVVQVVQSPGSSPGPFEIFKRKKFRDYRTRRLQRLDIRCYRADILQPMFGKPLALVLAFSWVVFSGFDLLEDLKLASEHSAYSQSGKSLSPNWIRHAGLANNAVESAINASAFYTPLLRLNLSQSSIHPLSSSHRALDLHKLHRVFLI